MRLIDFMTDVAGFPRSAVSGTRARVSDSGQSKRRSFIRDRIDQRGRTMNAVGWFSHDALIA